MPDTSAPSYVTPPFASYPVALRFDPTRQSKVTVPDWSGLGLGGPRISAQAWIRPEDAQTERMIICAGDQQRGFFLQIVNGNYEVGVNRDGQTTKASAPVPDGDLNHWIHVCGTYDGSAWHIHRNGDHLADLTTPVGLPDGITGDLAIGCRPNSTAFFAGQIRNVCVWKEPRTAEQELRDLFAVDSKVSSVALYLPMYEGEGDLCIDLSLGANDGTVTNAIWDVPVKVAPNTMFFPGAKDGAAPYVTIPGASLTERKFPSGQPSAITISAWIRAGSQNANPAIERVIVGNDTCVLRMMNGAYEFGMLGDANNWVMGVIPAGDANQWVHLSGAYDPNRQEWRLLRNGFLLASQASTTGFVAPPAGTNWYIGGSSRAYASPSLLEIRMVWLHTFPVGIPSIRTVYMPRSNEDGLPDNPTVHADGLVAYWPLDDGGGDQIYDMRWTNEEEAALRADGTFDPALMGWSFAPPMPKMVFVNANTTGVGSALATIRDNSAAKPYRVYLGPGNFQERITLKPWVSLVGAGEQQTTLSYEAQDFGGVLNLSGDGFEVRQMTVISTFTGLFGAMLVAIQVNAAAKARLDHVTSKLVCTPQAEGANIRGFYVQGKNPASTKVELSNCTLLAENTPAQGSAASCAAGTLTMLNCDVSGGYWGTLIVFAGGYCRVHGGTIRAPAAGFSAIVAQTPSKVDAYGCTIVGRTEGSVTLNP